MRLCPMAAACTSPAIISDENASRFIASPAGLQSKTRPTREINQRSSVWKILCPGNLLRKTIALRGAQESTGIVIEFRAELGLAHRVFRGPAVVLFDLLEHTPVLQRDPYRALEPARAGERRIDGVLDLLCEREHLGIETHRVAVGVLAEASGIERLGHRVLQAHAAMRLRRRRALLRHRLADDRHVELGDRTLDADDISSANTVLRAQSQNSRHVRMQYVRRRKRLERRVAALPMAAEPIGDAAEVLRNGLVLQM